MADPQEKKEKDIIGLKKRRAGHGARTPTYKCDNCGCIRFSECYCTRAAKENL